MKVIISCSLLIIFFASCCKVQLSTADNNRVVFHTVKKTFFTTDSIETLIENNSDSNFDIIIRCGSYLEMYYQKKENDTWSENLWFSWMSLACRSTPETIEKNSNFQFIIPSNEINASGTYRLILANDTSLVSNSFEIK